MQLPQARPSSQRPARAQPGSGRANNFILLKEFKHSWKRKKKKLSGRNCFHSNGNIISVIIKILAKIHNWKCLTSIFHWRFRGKTVCLFTKPSNMPVETYYSKCLSSVKSKQWISPYHLFFVQGKPLVGRTEIECESNTYFPIIAARNAEIINSTKKSNYLHIYIH